MESGSMGSIQTAEMRGARQGEEPRACAREVGTVNTARAKGRRPGRRNEKVSGRDVAGVKATTTMTTTTTENRNASRGKYQNEG